jgi:hypothetical protein
MTLSSVAPSRSCSASKVAVSSAYYPLSADAHPLIPLGKGSYPKLRLIPVLRKRTHREGTGRLRPVSTRIAICCLYAILDVCRVVGGTPLSLRLELLELLGARIAFGVEGLQCVQGMG